MPRTYLSAVLACLVLWHGSSAAAEERRALVLGDLPGDDAIVEALRVQLAGVVVEVVAFDPQGALPHRVRVAENVRRERGAVLALWVEDAGAQWVAYVVGGRIDGALVEIVEVNASAAWDAARELALKVRDVLDLALAARDTRQVALPARSTDVPTSSSTAPPAPSARATRVGLSAILEARLAAGAIVESSRAQAEIRLGAGVGGAVGDLRLEAIAAVGLDGVASAAANGAVDVLEWGAVVQLRALGGGDLSLGGGLGAGVRILHASGKTTDGREGAAVRAVPVLCADLFVRFSVARDLAIEVGAGVELSLVRQWFALDAVTVLDAGLVRLAGSVAFVVQID